MFDLELIERALDAAATCGYGEARAEFDRLRKAMEGAIERDVIEGNAGAHGFHVVHTPSQWAGHRVLLVKCDE